MLLEMPSSEQFTGERKKSKYKINPKWQKWMKEGVNLPQYLLSLSPVETGNTLPSSLDAK